MSESGHRLAVRFIGSGDAFGSGGRLQTCIHVQSASRRFLIDCGASSMVGLRAHAIDPDTLDAIVLTHFHGDHCAGVAFLLMHAMLASKRTAALVIAGPTGTRKHVRRLLDVLFPGSSHLQPQFPLEYVEMEPRQSVEFAGISVTTWPALHAPQTHPTIVRIRHAERTVVYTGDTGWTDDLVPACDGADLLIAECYLDGTATHSHLTRSVLRANRARLNAKAIVLTHAADEILAVRDALPEILADDGSIFHV